jgi:hypothetical protein
MDPIRQQKRQNSREQLWSVMHNGKGKAGQVFNFTLVLLILISVSILPIKFLPAYPSFENVIDGLEALIVAIFTVEYFVRIYAAPNRLRYIFSFFGFVDLLSIAPFYTGVFGTEYIRILRVVRFLKIGEMQAGAAADNEVVMEKTIGLAKGETVEYVVTKHPLFLFIQCIPPVIALSFSLSIFLIGDGNPVGLGIGFTLVIFAFIFLLKGWLDFNYYLIYLTNYRLVFHNQHLFGRSINQVNYFSITNVKPEYGSIFSFIFRYGSLDIETAADTPGEIKISMVRQHEKAAHMIMQKCFAMQNQRATGDRLPIVPDQQRIIEEM